MDRARFVERVSPALALARKLERLQSECAWQCAITLAVLFLAAAVVLSARSKMWFDELFTYYMVHQASSSEMIRALKERCDAQPPLYPLVVRVLAPVLGSGPLALRFPSAIGVTVMGLCVFAFVLRRLPALYALLAMLFAYNSTRYFATEARCYGLVLGCAGVALLCWQRVTERRRRSLALFGLALALACGISLHYFTVFLLLPLSARQDISIGPFWGLWPFPPWC